MDDKDAFAVWLADAVLQTRGDFIGAAVLNQMMDEATSSADFEAKLGKAVSQEKRPGDMGVELIGPLLPILLVTLGRELWESYSKELVEKGGKALADSTVGAIKRLFRQKVTSSGETGVTDQQLREAAVRAGFSAEQADKLLTTLHSPELAQTIVA